MVRSIQIIIVGAQKSGTTSLFRYLAQHPEIHTHLQNEMCYFVHDEFKKDYDHVFLKYFGNNLSKGKILLAKHVMIMYSQKAVDRLYNHNPQIQIIAMLRNPIRRAYSAYWYARRMGWEKIMTFEDAIKAEPYRLREGWLKWSNCAYLSNGEYYTHIVRLMKRFSEEQIHIYILEDMKNNPDKVCQGIFSLFEIDRKFSPMTGIMHNKATQARSEIFARAYSKFLNPNNPFKKIIRHLFPYQLLYTVRQNIKELNKKEFSPPPMNPETKKFLIDYFMPHNEKLSRLINRNIDHWNKADE